MDYQRDFLSGDLLYQEMKYKEAIAQFEKSLLYYWDALEDCRLACEDFFDHGWFPDFIPAIANHYTVVLRCRLKCLPKLSFSIERESEDSFVSAVLNYLQYSYYQVENLEQSCYAIESILFLDLYNSAQNRNKHYLQMQKSLDSCSFVPRKEIVAYKRRNDKEEKLLSFIDQNFVVKKVVQEQSELNDEVLYSNHNDENEETNFEDLSENLSDILYNFDDNDIEIDSKDEL